MHVLAGLDVALRRADDGVVLAHRLARGDAARGDLVAGGHLRAQAQAELGQRLAERERRARDQHVVVGVQPDQRRGDGDVREDGGVGGHGGKGPVGGVGDQFLPISSLSPSFSISVFSLAWLAATYFS